MVCFKQNKTMVPAALVVTIHFNQQQMNSSYYMHISKEHNSSSQL